MRLRPAFLPATPAFCPPSHLPFPAPLCPVAPSLRPFSVVLFTPICFFMRVCALSLFSQRPLRAPLRPRFLSFPCFAAFLRPSFHPPFSSSIPRQAVHSLAPNGEYRHLASRRLVVSQARLALPCPAQSPRRIPPPSSLSRASFSFSSPLFLPLFLFLPYTYHLLLSFCTTAMHVRREKRSRSSRTLPPPGASTSLKPPEPANRSSRCTSLPSLSDPNPASFFSRVAGILSVAPRAMSPSRL